MLLMNNIKVCILKVAGKEEFCSMSEIECFMDVLYNVNYKAVYYQRKYITKK